MIQLALLFGFSVYAEENNAIDSWMQSIPALISADQYCSGVLIAKDTIATAYHCIAAGQKIYIEWEDGSKNTAKTVSAKVKTDVAILKTVLPTNDRPIIPLRTNPIHRGAIVYGLGHPFAPFSSGKYEDLLRWSVSQGIVSQVGELFIQTDTALNPGNSGGALVDDKGELVGIVSHKIQADNISFASTATQVRTIQENTEPLHWMGGIWMLYPSLSMGMSTSVLSSFDLNSSFFIRDRIHTQIKSRLYWNTLDEAKSRESIDLYPFSASMMARLRLGYGNSSVVFEGGGSISYEESVQYESEQLVYTTGYAFGWVSQLSLGGVCLRLEGIPQKNIFVLGISIDSVGWRGVF